MTHDIPRFTTSDGGLTWASTGTHGGYLDGDEGLTWAEQVARRDAEIAELREDRDDLRRRLRKTSDAYNDARNELYEANAEIKLWRAEIADLRAERDEWQARAGVLQARITEAVRLGDLTPLYGWTSEDRRRNEEFNATLAPGPEDEGPVDGPSVAAAPRTAQDGPGARTDAEAATGDGGT